MPDQPVDTAVGLAWFEEASPDAGADVLVTPTLVGPRQLKHRTTLLAGVAAAGLGVAIAAHVLSPATRVSQPPGPSSDPVALRAAPQHHPLAPTGLLVVVCSDPVGGWTAVEGSAIADTDSLASCPANMSPTASWDILPAAAGVPQ